MARLAYKLLSQSFILFFISAIFGLYILNAAAYGSSSEDLIGVFSIQKTIKLGSSSQCFNGTNDATDHLNPQNKILEDDQPPGLAGFNISPNIIKKSAKIRSIDLTIHVIDDQSGLKSSDSPDLSTASFVSPSGDHRLIATFDAKNQTSGHKLDGFYKSRITLPKDNETGLWLLDNITLVDERGNHRVLGRNDIVNLGFPTNFLVI
jgi:hypothetical protein